MAPPPPYPPDDYWYRRYWRYTNRPRPGCGCLYTLVVVLIAWWILSLLFPPFGWRYWWYGPVSELRQPQMYALVAEPVSLFESRAGSMWNYRVHSTTVAHPTPLQLFQ